MAKLSNLRGLAVENNQLGGYLPLSQLQSLIHLRVLHLHGNDFQGGYITDATELPAAGTAARTAADTDTSLGNQKPVHAAEILSLHKSEVLLRGALPECTIVIEILPETECCNVQ